MSEPEFYDEELEQLANEIAYAELERLVIDCLIVKAILETILYGE